MSAQLGFRSRGEVERRKLRMENCRTDEERMNGERQMEEKWNNRPTGKRKSGGVRSAVKVPIMCMSDQLTSLVFKL